LKILLLLGKGINSFKIERREVDMQIINLVIYIMFSGIVLKVLEKEIRKISIVIREKPFEAFMVIGMIILLLNFIA